MIVIRPPATQNELRAGLELVRSRFFDEFGTAPEPEGTPKNFFVAVDEDSSGIVGTISLQVTARASELELEMFFDCHLSDFYSGAVNKVGGIGRYTATRPGVSRILLCYIIKFAEQTGIEFLLSFNRQSVARLAQRGGFSFTSHRPTVRQNNILEKYWPYFLNQDDPVIVLTQYTNALTGVADSFVRARADAFRLEFPGQSTATTAVVA